MDAATLHGIDTGGVHAGMAQQLLNIFRRCPAIDHVACEGVTENMEVEVLDIIECDVGSSARRSCPQSVQMSHHSTGRRMRTL